eukprot:TRINITY_DN21694_c0_g1_i1.p1 TRINITY_DN21694_c0_g1~~TRINITY_DN21694_c0_g1_i1.p1  ORF type:complete len:263 (+),score=76.89 TRINITY_DN21694_c0_g1_i1:72-791(+)
MACPQILLVGDSLTGQGFSVEHTGWASRLADTFNQQFDVVNRGASGHNTRSWAPFWAKQVLDVMSRAPSPVVTLCLGANDSAAGIQHVPVREYEDRLLGYARSILEHESWQSDIRLVDGTAVTPVLVVISPPSVDDAKWDGADKRCNATVAEYVEAAQKVVTELSILKTHGSVRFVNLFERLGCPDEMQWDGLHLSAAGNQRMAELVMSALAEAVPQLDPQKLPRHIKWWRECMGETAE